MTMMGTISLKDRFKLTDSKQYKAEFFSKSEFNNMQMWLKRREVEYTTLHKKRSKYRGEVFSIVLVSPVEMLNT